ncbi:GNAT family N-acetyltransferase [Burkholderia plantarii]|uniref:GNAT family N-acetyltransferase n=1 Tax=Burkholderia plantarii TaxID=41899 RepID=UPI0009F36EDE|nr:GNAT family N-acetyltransferase [Burkholderia plantarii]
MSVDPALPAVSGSAFDPDPVPDIAAPRIVAFEPDHANAAIALILHVQNVEAGVAIPLDAQPELLDIARHFTETGGGFWVALDAAGQVVGTIGLQLKAPGVAVMKKFFVAAAWRGAGKGCASRLFAVLLARARQQRVATLLLDTPAVATRSHAFYRRHGFVEIAAHELPVRHDFPDRDSLLFRLDLPRG